MRVIFIFFLLVNAAYFYTQSDFFNPQTGSVILKQQDLPEGVERLSLLRERGLGASATKTPRKSTAVNKKPKGTKKVAKPAPVSKKQPVKKSATKKVAKAKVAPKPKPKPKKNVNASVRDSFWGDS